MRHSRIFLVVVTLVLLGSVLPAAAQEEKKKKEARPRPARKEIKKSSQLFDDITKADSKRMTSPFGYRSYRNSLHRGIDLGYPNGTELGALAGGKGWTATYTSGNGGAGNYVILTNGKVEFQYYHLTNMTNRLAELGYQNKNGKWIIEGVQKHQVIALSNNTGHSTGPHLHLGLRINGKYESPLGYFKRKIVHAPEFQDPPKEGTATSNTSVRIPDVVIRVRSWDLKEVSVILSRASGKSFAKKIKTLGVADGLSLIHIGGGKWKFSCGELKDLPTVTKGSWTFKITARTYGGRRTSHTLTVKR